MKKFENNSTVNLFQFPAENTMTGIGIALEYYSIFLFGYFAFIILQYFFS